MMRARRLVIRKSAAVSGEVGVEGWEGCSGTCVLAQPQTQSGKGLAAAVEAVVGCIRLWEMARFPNVGHPSLGDVLP
jgi:hypothetical protein